MEKKKLVLGSDGASAFSLLFATARNADQPFILLKSFARIGRKEIFFWANTDLRKFAHGWEEPWLN